MCTLWLKYWVYTFDSTLLFERVNMVCLFQRGLLYFIYNDFIKLIIRLWFIYFKIAVITATYLVVLTVMTLLRYISIVFVYPSLLVLTFVQDEFLLRFVLHRYLVHWNSIVYVYTGLVMKFCSGSSFQTIYITIYSYACFVVIWHELLSDIQNMIVNSSWPYH